VEVQLHLTDRPVNLVEQGFDLSVRIGTLPDARLTARKLASNARVLCASPRYLAKAGEPAHPRELPQHSCLFIREGDEAFGSWHLRSGGRQETVKVRGALSSNDGECALAWALDGHGIMVFPTKAHMSAKTRALVEFLHEGFEARREGAIDGASPW
jgi:DNA-binding transcriptional LysR family regulator